jgi:phosphatidylserine/phosphatidylglycerophosphate/cardiolipin synthase-like enzyme
VKFSGLRATICRGQGEQPSQFLLHGYLDSNAIVSSANLTDDAFTRNMELGVLLKNNLMANELWWHLETMIQQGFLHKVSDFSD